MRVRGGAHEAGFTLVELMVATSIMLLVLAGTMQVMTSALNSQKSAKQTMDMNSSLRAAMDLMQRDMLQVGQGLPVGRRIGVPNGTGATVIGRAGPAVSGACPGAVTFPVGTSIPAVSVGPGRGPAIGGVCTDVITTMAADNMFGPVGVAAIAANGRSAVIHNRDPLGNALDISDSPDAAGDNVRAGDLMMITKGSSSVLMQVTGVSGQTLTFGTGATIDPLGLNQFDIGLTMQGTINRLKAAAPVDPNTPVLVSGVQQAGPSEATRIRMITYFVDTTTSPRVPRLVRRVGGGVANAVGLGVQAFVITYDIADAVNNPTDVRMVAADLNGTGRCDDSGTAAQEACSENQVRKVNLVLSMSAQEGRSTVNGFDRQSQNTLRTQISLRSMAFVDRYR